VKKTYFRTTYKIKFYYHLSCEAIKTKTTVTHEAIHSHCCSQESMESFSKSVNFIEKIILSPKYECTMQRHIYTYGGNNIHACTLNFETF
jgi:hypothetical protein